MMLTGIAGWGLFWLYRIVGWELFGFYGSTVESCFDAIVLQIEILYNKYNDKFDEYK